MTKSDITKALKETERAGWESNTTHILPGLCKSSKQNFLNQQKHKMTLAILLTLAAAVVIYAFREVYKQEKIEQVRKEIAEVYARSKARRAK